MTRCAFVFIAVVVVLALPGAAWSHARLLHTQPANGAVLAAPPTELRVVFDDVVRAGPGIEAVRNGGGSILAGKAHVDARRTLVVPLHPGARHGAFSVRWAVISDDGHLESGIVAFAVGKGQATPLPTLRATDTAPAADDVVSRWLLYVGLLAVVGLAFLGAADTERLALFLTTAAVLAAVGAGSEAHAAGLDTRAGTALGATALAAVVVATLAGAATLAPRVLAVARASAPLLVLGPAFAGHAYDHGVGRVQVAVDSLHLLGASAWVGALVGLVAFRDAQRRRTVVLAAAGVVVLAATGVIRAWSELSRWSQIWDTSYGRALMIKTGVLVAALAFGWLLRAQARRRAGIELAFVAGILVAVAFLVLLPPGRSIGGGLVRVSTAEPGPRPPRVPPGAVVVAQEMGDLGVALELEPQRTTAVVLSPSGGGLDGLEVELNGHEARPCGGGCYRVERPPGKAVDVVVNRFGPQLEQSFGVPSLRRPGGALLRRIGARFRALRSVFYLETLASSTSHTVTSLWRLESPNRVSYQIPGGAAGIVIGAHRWDRERPDAAWQKSAQSELTQPATAWAAAADVHVVADDGTTKTLTFDDPGVPAFFRLVVDAKTLLPRELRMTASAHFMVDRYVRFNAPRAIVPPR